MISAFASRRAAAMLALGLVLAGGALRFQQAWSHRAVYLSDTMQEEGYYESAIGLLSYQAFSIGVPNDTPRSWRGPIFPVFIALIESLWDEPDPGRVRLAQAALATFSILLVFALGWAVYSPAAGLLGAALLAFNAEHAAAVASLNIHALFVPYPRRARPSSYGANARRRDPPSWPAPSSASPCSAAARISWHCRSWRPPRGFGGPFPARAGARPSS
jgi:hypothetical protein